MLFLGRDLFSKDKKFIDNMFKPDNFVQVQPPLSEFYLIKDDPYYDKICMTWEYDINVSNLMLGRFIFNYQLIDSDQIRSMIPYAYWVLIKKLPKNVVFIVLNMATIGSMNLYDRIKHSNCGKSKIGWFEFLCQTKIISKKMIKNANLNQSFTFDKISKYLKKGNLSDEELIEDELIEELQKYGSETFDELQENMYNTHFESPIFTFNSTYSVCKISTIMKISSNRMYNRERKPIELIDLYEINPPQSVCTIIDFKKIIFNGKIITITSLDALLVK